MKFKRILFILTTLLVSITTTAQDKQLSAFFNNATFFLPEQRQPYVETYLSVDAWSLNFIPVKDGYRATVEVILQAKQGDSIRFIKKYDLNSPLVNNPDQTNFSFIDLQRFSLDNGMYDLVLSLKDKNASGETAVVTQKLSVRFDKKKPSMSTIQLMTSAKKTTTQNIFSRGGYDMEPYVSDFVPEQINQLNFYYEIYNIDNEIGGKPFATYCYIEDKTTGQRVSNIQSVSRHESTDLLQRYVSLDISALPSGNYNLVVEAHDKNNDLLMYNKTAFYRSNPSIQQKSEADLSTISTTFAGQINDENLLRYYIDALYPIASDKEKNVGKDLAKRNNLEEKQVFFYNFWNDRNSLDPESAWKSYKERLEYVDQHFSYPKTPGYRTDRGRVYLQYGPPDFIRDEKNFVGALHLGSGTARIGSNDAALGHVYYLPYQLWRYNLPDKDDANRVFLFWDEMRSGFYKLLVSNARGEVWDPLWERRLSQQQLEEYVVGEVGEQFNRGY